MKDKDPESRELRRNVRWAWVVLGLAVGSLGLCTATSVLAAVEGRQGLGLVMAVLAAINARSAVLARRQLRKAQELVRLWARFRKGYEAAVRVLAQDQDQDPSDPIVNRYVQLVAGFEPERGPDGDHDGCPELPPPPPPRARGEQDQLRELLHGAHSGHQDRAHEDWRDPRGYL